MNLQETMKKLEAMGTAQNKKIYQRHGSGDNLYGVSFANLNKLEKKIKRNHSLAIELWQTGNIDAMTLATMIADPKKMTENDIDNWVKELKYYLLTDLFVRNIVVKTEWAEKKIMDWSRSKDEWLGRAGWQLLANYAMSKEDIPDDFFSPFLREAETKIHNEKNRTREAMNMAVISIGIRNEALRSKAEAAAKTIGKVEVDHGDTSCKTPDAIPYMEKAWARKMKK